MGSTINNGKSGRWFEGRDGNQGMYSVGAVTVGQPQSPNNLGTVLVQKTKEEEVCDLLGIPSSKCNVSVAKPRKPPKPVRPTAPRNPNPTPTGSTEKTELPTEGYPVEAEDDTPAPTPTRSPPTTPTTPVAGTPSSPATVPSNGNPQPTTPPATTPGVSVTVHSPDLYTPSEDEHGNKADKRTWHIGTGPFAALVGVGYALNGTRLVVPGFESPSQTTQRAGSAIWNDAFNFHVGASWLPKSSRFRLEATGALSFARNYSYSNAAAGTPIDPAHRTYEDFNSGEASVRLRLGVGGKNTNEEGKAPILLPGVMFGLRAGVAFPDVSHAIVGAQVCPVLNLSQVAQLSVCLTVDAPLASAAQRQASSSRITDPRFGLSFEVSGRGYLYSTKSK